MTPKHFNNWKKNISHSSHVWGWRQVLVHSILWSFRITPINMYFSDFFSFFILWIFFYFSYVVHQFSTLSFKSYCVFLNHAPNYLLHTLSSAWILGYSPRTDLKSSPASLRCCSRPLVFSLILTPDYFVPKFFLLLSSLVSAFFGLFKHHLSSLLIQTVSVLHGDSFLCSHSAEVKNRVQYCIWRILLQSWKHPLNASSLVTVHW